MSARIAVSPAGLPVPWNIAGRGLVLEASETRLPELTL
jgi:hypothetical protein